MVCNTMIIENGRVKKILHAVYVNKRGKVPRMFLNHMFESVSQRIVLRLFGGGASPR